MCLLQLRHGYLQRTTFGKSGSEIVKEGYGFNEIHWCKRRGGGLALLHKTNLKVKRLSQCMSPSIESAVWILTGSH